MRILGEISLLIAFVASGYAAFACLTGDRDLAPRVRRSGLFAACAALLGLTVTLAVLLAALWARDFSFDYVARYSSQKLPWRFALSAAWVGQAGSLLLWTWFTAVLATIFRFARRDAATRLEDTALALVMVFVCFLSTIMVFAADPMQASAVTASEGAGLSPSLQHPAMMIHPPIVFCGYAAWTIPCALALAALWTGRLDLRWVHEARPWAVLAWVVLGVGILLGADWAYEELGWGGYWGWDPVENGSLIPWLTGTTLIHSLLVWRHRDGLKKTALALAVVTFGMCNFATFLTRSGIFSSLHAFSQSPIGWMFLSLMCVLTIAGAMLIVWRRQLLAGTMRLVSIYARETVIVVSTLAILLLAGVIFVGTVFLPVSMVVTGTMAVVGPAFYNAVLAPIGLVLLVATVPVPLLHWGGPPSQKHRRGLLLCGAAAIAAAVIAAILGIRRPEALLISAFAVAAPVALVSAWFVQAGRASGSWPAKLLGTIRVKRRAYAAYVIHLGFVMVAIGIAGSSIGSQQRDVALQEGEVEEWQGRRIRYVKLTQTELPDKTIVAAELDIDEGNGTTYRLAPARHFHRLQEQWTTEVDIHSSWCGDLYTILNSGAGERGVSLTLVENPLMRWLWCGGALSMFGALVTLWPVRAKVTKGLGGIPLVAPSTVEVTSDSRSRAA